MIWFLTVALWLNLLFGASADAASANDPRKKIVIGGAQSITPLAERFSKGFLQNHPGIEIEIRGGGSNYAVRSVLNSEMDIGLVTRKLNENEKGRLHAVSIGHDAIMLLTYPGNTVFNLSMEQLRKIYRGQIVNWREIGGNEKGIVALTRETSSALRGTFIEHVFGRGFNGSEKAFTIRASKEKILRTIKRIEGSIGYGIVKQEEAESQGVHVLSIEGIAPTPENIARGVYPLTRPQLAVSKGAHSEIIREWLRGFVRFASETATAKERP